MWLEEAVTCLAAQNGNQSHQSKLRKHTDPGWIPSDTVSSLPPPCAPCLRKQVLQLSGTWDSGLMSLMGNQLHSFEAQRPWCLMYFQWTLRCITVFVRFAFHSLKGSAEQTQKHFSPDIKGRTLLQLSDVFCTDVDILGPFINLGTAKCSSASEQSLLDVHPLGQWFPIYGFVLPEGVLSWI